MWCYIEQTTPTFWTFVLPNEVPRLTRERTASGKKYFNGRMSFGMKGTEATLKSGSRNFSCVED